MSLPILATKLYIPPPRPKVVLRPRLIERLNEGLHRKLTLISAPAGFGKTTLVSSWIHDSRFAIDDLQAEAASQEKIANPKLQIQNRVAWLSLDEGDNDLARFLIYFVAALRTIETSIDKGALGMLQSPQPPPTEAVLTSLLNEIAALPDRIVLILDDYHLIETQSIHDVLSFLLDHMPPQMHLVIVTRDDPQLPLARLRARGQLTELRAADLHFSSSEATEFLNQAMGLDLSEDDIIELETRTEGWIVGLQLAAISMQGRADTANFIKSFTGSHRFVLDYLIEEVLEQQSENVQRFLLQTAVLNRLTGSLCDALTGQNNGRATLEVLEHANLFIVPLDDERRWYRYHHLFADLLRSRLHQTQLAKTSTLHSKASAWYEQNGFPNEAIEHSLHAENFERATQLLDAYIDKILNQGEYANAWRWLNKIPEEFVLSKPDLCILNAWQLFTSGHLDAAEQSLQAAEKHLLPGANPAVDTSINASEPIVAAKIRGRVAATRALLASFRGDVPGIIQNAHQALDLLPKQDLAWRSTVAIALCDAYGITGDMNAAYKVRVEALETSKAAGNIYLILLSAMKLAITVRMQGQLQRVIDICQQYHRLANERGVSQIMVVGWLFAVWAEVLAEINELDEAITKGRRGVELTARSEDVAMIGWSHLCLTKILFTRLTTGHPLR